MTNPDKTAAEVAQGLSKVLDMHGHGFQYRALTACIGVGHVGMGGIGRWELVDAETVYDLPDGRTGHIDGILKLVGASIAETVDVLVVVECKRVDPRLGRWGFVRTPFTYGNSALDRGVYDSLTFTTSAAAAEIRAIFLRSGQSVPFGLGFELRASENKGDGVGGRSEAIDHAVSQVLRGTAGLFRNFAMNFPRGRTLVVIPLILTTAEVWTSDVRLTDADLATGRVGEIKTDQWPRVVMTQRVSRNLLAPWHDGVLYRVKGLPIGDALAARQIDQHARSIWIASHDGIETALTEIAMMVNQEF